MYYLETFDSIETTYTDMRGKMGKDTSLGNCDTPLVQ